MFIVKISGDKMHVLTLCAKFLDLSTSFNHATNSFMDHFVRFVQVKQTVDRTKQGHGCLTFWREVLIHVIPH